MTRGRITIIVSLFLFLHIPGLFYSCKKEAGPPVGIGNQLVITTRPIVNAGTDTALSGGEITQDGGAAVTARGVCWSRLPNPKIGDSCSRDGTGTGQYSSKLLRLSANTQYYVRAYATHYYGTIYGESRTFRTATSIPIVITLPAGSISYNTAIAGGNVQSDQGSPVTRRGLVCNTTINPSLSNYLFTTSDGSGTGIFSSSFSGLSANTTYHIRAYATNANGTAYGRDTVFTTLAIQPPTVSTICTPVSLGYTSATLEGSISSTGGAPLAAAGICYSSTTASPTVANSTSPGSPLAVGSFRSSLTGLTAGTTYYYRAYARNTTNANYSYGATCSFTTPAIQPPTVSTSCSPVSLSSNTASLQGTVSATGGAPLATVGICYSSTTASPTVANSTSPGSPLTVGSFSSSLTGLSAGTTYYYRAYARNTTNANYSYGATCSFTTLSIQPPTVSTSCSPVSLSSNAATLQGTISATGGAPLAAAGICYSSTTALPTTADNMAVGSPLALGTFNASLTGLRGGTTYYYRAYARNNSNSTISYGSVCSFTTPAIQPPTVSTSCSPVSLSSTAATLQGTISATGGAPLAAAGICYSSSSVSPTVANNTAAGSPLAVGTFNASLTGLSAGTTYYYRAYARNNTNSTYSYGSVCTFFTPAILPPTVSTSCSPVSISLNAATLQGTISSTGSGSLIASGICYSSSTTSPTIANNTATGSPLALGTFNSSLTGLAAGTTYYYRAYARNNANSIYSYGSTCSFTTPSAQPPTVTTICPSISSITSSSAVVGGNVTQLGSFSITERGFCYSSTNSNPTVGNSSQTTSGSGTGSFASTLSGLINCTVYYARAYARNSAGLLSYGTVCMFSTLPGSPSLLTPTNGQQLTSSSYCIYFSWSPLPCATSYQIQISRSSNFSFATQQVTATCGSTFWISNTANNQYTTAQTNLQINSGGSSQNGIWYWRVRALNGSSAGTWSVTRSYRYTW